MAVTLRNDPQPEDLPPQQGDREVSPADSRLRSRRYEQKQSSTPESSRSVNRRRREHQLARSRNRSESQQLNGEANGIAAKGKSNGKPPKRSFGRSSEKRSKKPLTAAQRRQVRERHLARLATSPSTANPHPASPPETTAPRRPNSRTDNSSSLNRKRGVRSAQKRPLSPLLYVVRLLILGVGIGTIAGTILSISDPATRQSELNPTEKKEVQASDTGGGVPSPISLAQDLPDLKAKIQGLLVADSKLQPGVFFVDLDTNSYLDLDGSVLFPAASTIKVPILVAFFQDVDAGKIRLDEMLTLEPEVIGSGSGDLQYKKVGTQYTALEVATKMIAISDNTATNMLITRLGGQEVLNERFRRWGLTATGIQNPLPDLEGTNTTSPKDLAMLMSMVNQGDLLSMRSRDRLLSIMNRTVNNSLLPKGLGDGATIAHKTGDIGSLIADVGLVDMPSGKRYIAVVMVRRPHNDASASELIRQISRTAYEFFSQPPSTTPSTTSTPTGRTATTSQNITAGNLL